MNDGDTFVDECSVHAMHHTEHDEREPPSMTTPFFLHPFGRISALLFVIIATPIGAAEASVPSPSSPNTPSNHKLLREGTQLRDAMMQRSHHVHHLLRAARRARNKDAERCLDRSLMQTHAMERLGTSDFSSLGRALRSGDEETASQHLERLKRFDHRSNLVALEASNCGFRLKETTFKPRR